MTAGVSRSQVVYDILNSAEARTDLVEGYYKDFLGRPADPGGLAFWVGQLNSGLSDQSVLEGILGSAEFYTDSGGTAAGFVTALYGDLLGRAPDPGGLAFWENALSSGASRSSVVAGILGSTEFLRDFVNSEYVTLLGRSADSGGLSFWVSQLQAGATSEAVIAGIAGSAEYYTDTTT